MNVRSLFMDAVKVAPCILFIDEIDAIASRRDLSSAIRDRGNVVQQLLTCKDDLNHVVDSRTETQSHGHVVVIWASKPARGVGSCVSTRWSIRPRNISGC